MLHPRHALPFALAAVVALTACSSSEEPVAQASSATPAPAEPTQSPAASPSPTTIEDPAVGLVLSSETTLTGGSGSRALHWSPEGRRAAYVSVDDDVASLAIATRDGAVLIADATARDFHEARWSPDGRTIAVVAAQPEGTYEVWVVDALTGEASTCGSAAFVTGLGWDAESTRVIASVSMGQSDVEDLEASSTVSAMTVSECSSDGGAGGEMTALADGFSAVVSPDGDVAAYAFIDDRGALGYATVPVDGGSPTVVIEPRPRNPDLIWEAVRPSWSPSGDALAAVVPEAGNPGDRELVTVSATGSDASILASGATLASPQWSPDGEWIAYRTPSASSDVLDVVPANGGESRTMAYGHNGLGPVEWNPDSVGMRVTQDSTDAWTAFGLAEVIAPVEGSLVSAVEGQVCESFALAPDGAALCVMGDDDEFEGVTLVPPA